MPSMPGAASIRRLFLPSTRGLADDQKAWVDLDLSPLKAGDTLHVYANHSHNEATLIMLTSRVKDWNFTEAIDGVDVKCAINYDTMKQLDIDDFNYLADELNRVVNTAPQPIPKAPNAA